MIYRRARILTAILTTFLVSTSHCFGTTIYVNSSSPAGGNGLSWAQAYNNLQSALAVAGTFDQVWIAQGTYKPSSPAGRSATFNVQNGTTIYGGFSGAGTETSNTQANPTLYPTILSGDIGVPGNTADNCYHVVTLNANLWIGECHGVTIRDGRADAGSSSLAQADNTGGGVLFTSVNSSNGAGTYFYNCIFTNNYAYYGGAMGTYGISTNQINYNATNCFFLNNQAVYGGAIYNTTVASDYLYVFIDDVFYNNTASSGAASAFGNAAANGTSTEYLDMENCLFYNEAAPIFTNDFSNSAFSFVNINYNIIWTSGTPYTAGYSGGNTPLAVSYSDINGSFPLGTNMDADPLFVNPAAGDFHVSPCSPVIDQGPSYASPHYDIGGSPRLQGSLVDLGPYETLKGTVAALPTVTTPVNACLNSTTPNLPSEVTGANLLWYTAATGGTGSSTAPTPSTAALGTTPYYVTQTPSGSCESPRQEIDVTVNSLPSAPTYTPVPPYCVNAIAAPLSATGTDLQWYTTATGGSGSSTAPTPGTAAAATTPYYVTQTVNGCESDRLEMDVTVNPIPSAPTFTPPPSYCVNDIAAPLRATGAGLQWYTTATGGSGNPTTPIPSTAAAAITPFYVTQTANGCESPRTLINVTVTATPSAPTYTPIPPYCVNNTAIPLSATGTDLKWYTTAAGGSGDPTAPTPSTATPITATWWVTQTVAGCESPRQAISVTVSSPSAEPTANPVSPYCQNTTASQLTANGTDLLWYSTATGGSSSSTAPTPNTAVIATTPYYVTQTTAGSCESGRLEIDVTVKPTPQLSVDPVTTALCPGATLKLQANGADSYSWSPAAGLSDPSVGNPIATVHSDILYTVTGTMDGCDATAQVDVKIGTNCSTSGSGSGLRSGYSFPNAFTPNGDGANDLFRVKTGDTPKSFKMTIFNRYGGKIFETADVGIGWDGTIEGNLAPTGTYVYMIALTTSSGMHINKQGTVVLIR